MFGVRILNLYCKEWQRLIQLKYRSIKPPVICRKQYFCSMTLYVLLYINNLFYVQ